MLLDDHILGNVSLTSFYIWNDRRAKIVLGDLSLEDPTAKCLAQHSPAADLLVDQGSE